MVYFSLYQKYFPELSNDKEEAKVCCPFHDDTSPSLSINLRTGEWHCFACQAGGGVMQFMHKLDAGGNVYETLTQLYETSLHDRPSILNFITSASEISIDTVRKYRIGYDTASSRWTIPFINNDDVVIGFKKYAPMNAKNKMMHVGDKTLVYPFDILASCKYLIFVEGELDALCLVSNNLPAITLEPPNNFDIIDEIDLRDMPCIICYDSDEAGRINTSKISKKLYSKTKKVKILDLAPYKDVKDYVHSKGIEEFVKLVEETMYYEPSSSFEYQSLSTLLQPERYGITYSTDITVTGKHTNYKLLPKSFILRCGYADDNPICERCGIAKFGGNYSVDNIPYTYEDITEVVDAEKSMLTKFLKNMINIPSKCNAVNFKFTTHIPVANVKVNSMIDTEESKVEQQVAYVLSADNDMTTNQNFRSEATFVRSQRDNSRILFLENLVQSDQRLRYDVSPDLLALNDQNEMSVWDKYLQILDDLEQHTKIAGRTTMLMALDLMFHSPLSIVLEDEKYKGYIDMIIIGDTRTGKSKASNALINLYQLGTMIGSENASIAGIIGGISLFANSSFLSWGVLPQNDKRLVILDEANSLSNDIIDRLSYIRSTGIAEIVKINTNKTMARVRLCMITNPINGNNLSRNTYGIDEIKAFARSNQDISRFDYAVVVQANPDQNILVKKKTLHFDPVSLYNLVRFAWDISPDQIQYAFTFEELVKFSQRDAMQYQCDLPLVERNSFHEKILRVATAVAIRTFNYVDGKILVEQKHLEFASRFFYEIYSDKENGYLAYAVRKQANLSRVDFTKIKNTMHSILAIIGNETYTMSKLADRFKDCSVLTEREIDDIAGGTTQGKQIRQLLTAIRCLELTDGKWYKTPQFNSAIERILDNGNSEGLSE